MMGLILASNLAVMVCGHAEAPPPAGKAWVCSDAGRGFLVDENDPRAHPDLPATPMCDPMPTQIEVCRWDPRAGENGIGCPTGYVRKTVVVPGRCPTGNAWRPK